MNYLYVLLCSVHHPLSPDIMCFVVNSEHPGQASGISPWVLWKPTSAVCDKDSMQSEAT